MGWRDGGAVLDLEPDEMLLQIAGDEAVLAALPNYRSDPAFAGTYDENPYYDPNRDPVGPPRTPLTEYIRPERPARSGSFDLPTPEDAALARRLRGWLEMCEYTEADSR